MLATGYKSGLNAQNLGVAIDCVAANSKQLGDFSGTKALLLENDQLY